MYIKCVLHVYLTWSSTSGYHEVPDTSNSKISSAFQIENRSKETIILPPQEPKEESHYIGRNATKVEEESILQFLFGDIKFSITVALSLFTLVVIVYYFPKVCHSYSSSWGTSNSPSVWPCPWSPWWSLSTTSPRYVHPSVPLWGHQVLHHCCAVSIHPGGHCLLLPQGMSILQFLFGDIKFSITVALSLFTLVVIVFYFPKVCHSYSSS